MTRTKKIEKILAGRRTLTAAELDGVHGGGTGTAGFTLILDEAPALYGTRTEVKDAHDRYASAEQVVKYPL